MAENSVVRARIDEATKIEAAAVLAAMGLSLSDAFRMLLKRVAAEKALPFEPLAPNAETVEAMKAARRGDLVTVGAPGALLASLNAAVRYTNHFKRDYRREQSGQHGRKLDTL
jgi:DNA-damage-inducible protein J